MATSSEATQKKLKKFLERRHPEYVRMLPHWQFLELCYEGGRAWFPNNIFKYVKEGDKEYKDRLDRAYRFNHTKEVVDLVDKYLFKMEAHRKDADAPSSVQEFWKKSTLNGLKIKDFMRRVSRMTSTFGRIWVVVDNTGGVAGKTLSKAEEKTAGIRTYAYIVTPQHVLDLSYDDEGCLNWILIHEQVRDDEDPLNSSGKMADRYRLWTKENWTLFNVKTVAGKTMIEVDGPHDNELGEVPVFAADNTISHEPYVTGALIDDIAYLDKAVTNYLSNLDAIIQDQTFSQLAMPAQGVVAGEDAHDKLIEMGTKRIFTYDGEGNNAPFYLSPDVKQAELILKVINKIINEIYHTVGLAGERTKEDNAMGIDNSSGVAKAYDFERVNSLLTAKADSLEVVENRLARMVAKWNGEDEQVKEDLVSYPESFDVRGLYDEFDIAARLALVEAPDGMRRKQMESVIDKLFPALKKELRDTMVKELDDWPIDPIAQAAAMTQATSMAGESDGGGAPTGSTSGKKSGGAGTAAIKKEGKNSLANKLVKEGSK
jgi:hypothetical protein